MATRQVNVAIVGMGIGRSNGKALSKNARANVVALCDLENDRMAKFAKELPEDPKLFADEPAELPAIPPLPDPALAPRLI